MAEQSKVKINSEWLSVCGGCEVAIVDLHEKLLDVLDAVEIQRCPVLTDVKGYPPATVGLVSGAIRNEHDRHAAEQMRKSCNLIIAYGTCAAYGGISGAGMVHSREEIMQTVYGASCTTKASEGPTRMVDKLEKQVIPLDEAIKVDLYLPGCPPSAGFIFDALIALVQGRAPKATDETVCGRCTRKMRKTDQNKVRSNHDGIPDRDLCLLSQGYLCMGSVTLDRCMSPCPSNGIVCTGCAGPSKQILSEPNRDIRTEIAERMSRLTKIDKTDIIHTIERGSKSHYAYAMATKMIGSKPTFLIKKWISEVESER